MQIVLNCDTRLCSQFLAPGDNFFCKVMVRFLRIGQRPDRAV